MPPAQRSILSFFQPPSSDAAASASASASSAASTTRFRPLAPAPPAPPPSLARFVPPPASAAVQTACPTPGRALRSGGSPDPQLDLPPITPALAARIWADAGAVAAGEELVFAGAANANANADADADAPRIVAPRAAHVPDLVSVNAILLSVRYPDAFYRPVADRTRIASLFNRVIVAGPPGRDKVVGGVVCRLEPEDAGDPARLVIYVQSLALLSLHRGRGLAAAALDSIAATAAALHRNRVEGSASIALPALPPIRAIRAHVWTESDDALRWYEARGFARCGPAPIDNYYFALRPSTAWLVRRALPAAAAAKTTKTAKTAGPAAAASSLSFQNARPDMEWNDLPADMVVLSTATSAAASAAASEAPSAASSRSASRVHLTADGDELAPPPPPTGSARSNATVRKKRDRAYPAAMFGQ